MGQSAGEAIGGILSSPFINPVGALNDALIKPVLGVTPVETFSKDLGGLLGDAVGEDRKPTGSAAAAAPNQSGPTPTYSNPVETASARRRKLEALRMGVMSTIKTSAQGVQNSTALTKPVAQAIAPEATKTKLGL